MGAAFHDLLFYRYRVHMTQAQSLEHSFFGDALHVEFGALQKQ
jgi:hypothetical protein